MKTYKANAYNIDAVMLGVIREAVADTRAELNKIIDEAGDIALDAVAEKSPRSKRRNKKYADRRRYAKGWKKEGVSGRWTILNTSKPKLTHILTDGTDVRKTKQGFNRGEVDPDDHIDQAADKAERHIDRKLKNL